MLTTNCIWDGNSQIEQDNGDELDYNDLWEPWKNIIVSLKTATANISHLQKITRRKNKYINSDHIAEALENRNYLQHITIQIASNGNFVSIEFAKKELMEQFCCDPLSIQAFNITFYPEGTIKRRPPKRLMNVSFINIPPETLEQIVTKLLEQYADIEGTPMYVKKNTTGKHTVQVPECTKSINYTNIYHGDYPILSAKQLYLSTTYNQNNKNTTKIVGNTDKTTENKHTKLQRIQLPTLTQIKIQKTGGSNRYHRKKQKQQKRRQNNYNNITQRRNKYNHQTDQLPPEINTQNYPQLPQQQNQNKDTTTSTITTPAEEITVIP